MVGLDAIMDGLGQEEDGGAGRTTVSIKTAGGKKGMKCEGAVFPDEPDEFARHVGLTGATMTKKSPYGTGGAEKTAQKELTGRRAAAFAFVLASATDEFATAEAMAIAAGAIADEKKEAEKKATERAARQKTRVDALFALLRPLDDFAHVEDEAMHEVIATVEGLIEEGKETTSSASAAAKKLLYDNYGAADAQEEEEATVPAPAPKKAKKSRTKKSEREDAIEEALADNGAADVVNGEVQPS